MRAFVRTLVVVMLLGGFIAATLYSLSSGPVLAYHCRHSQAATLPLCRYYRPLFRIAPGPAGRYVNWCGASEIEVFFLFEPVQRNTFLSPFTK